MLPEFDLLRPETMPEALAILAEHGADAMPIAGGTNVLVDLRAGKHQPRVLVDVARLPGLRGIHRENGHLVIGGGTTISDLLVDPLIAQHAPALREAAAVFANPLIRNRATVGGNLADASPAADTAPPLLALDAEVELASQGGTPPRAAGRFPGGGAGDVAPARRTVDRGALPRATGRQRQPLSEGGPAQGRRDLGLERRRGRDLRRRRALHGCPHRPGRVGSAAAARDRSRDAAGRREADARGIAEAARLAGEAARPINDIRRLGRLPPAGDRGDRAAAVGRRC